MKTLGRNADNDLYLEAGGLAILHDAEAQCAIIESILQTQRGELQFDEDGGIDYFGTVLQNPNFIRFWAGQVTTKIESLDFVSSIEDFQYSFDAASSTLIWSMTVITTDNNRLDLQNKKTVLDGSPGVEVDWKNIYDKPTQATETLSVIADMRDEAEEVANLDEHSVLGTVKETINRIVYDPNSEQYAASRLIRFDFVGVPLGTVIDFRNLRLDIQNTGTSEPYFAPFTIEISDGTKQRCLTNKDGSSLQAEGNDVWFIDENKEPDEEGHYPPTQLHTIMSGGNVSITIRGNIAGINTADGENPIFLKSNGTAFPYLSGFSIGSRVPVIKIGKSAFKGYKNLFNIVWDKPTNSSLAINMEESAFEGCESLKSLIWMPSEVQSVGVRCFKECKSLLSLQGFVLGDSETTLPERCFEGCISLQDVSYLPSHINTIGQQAFFGCTSIKSIDALPNSIQTISAKSFAMCSGIEKILYLPESLKTIDSDAFYGCIALRSLFIPASVETIGSNAFANCPALTNVMCESKVPATIYTSDVGISAFDQDKLDIYVPQGSLNAYIQKDGWKKYWEDGVETIYEYGFAEFTLKNVAAGTTLLSNTGIVESNSIWSIEYRGTGVKPLRFESTTTSLPGYRFASIPKYEEEEGTSTIVITGFIRRMSAVSSDAYPMIATASAGNPYLTNVSIELKPSLEMLGNYAFAGCENLANFSVEGNNLPFCLGERTFWGCLSLPDMQWLNGFPLFGRLVETTETVYDLDEDGNIQYDEDGNPITHEEYTYFPAFGEGCYYETGITALGYPKTYIESLPEYCFAKTKIVNLSGIESTNLVELGAHCFEGCEELISIAELRNTAISQIPAYCFTECVGLQSIDGIENIEEMGEHAFNGCSSLTSIEPLFSQATNLSELPAYCFANCTSLSSLEGLQRIVKLGKYGFYGCSGLSSLSWLEYSSRLIDGEVAYLDAIPAYCFAGCSGLKTLVGCYNIESIGEGAFANCSNLRSPSGLGPEIVSIGNLAFQNCTGLQFFSCISSSVPTLGSTAFSGTPVSSLPLYVRDGMESLFAADSGWSMFNNNNITSRTIRIHFENIGGTTDEDINIDESVIADTYVKAEVQDGDTVVPGVWFVDFGDGSDIVKLSSIENNPERLVPHSYTERGSYDLTLFGDIAGFSGAKESYSETAHSEPEELSMPAFLNSIKANATSVLIKSPYLPKVSDFCFNGYGRTNEDFSVSINIAGNGAIGAYAFAKSNALSTTVLSCNATTIEQFAFYDSSLSNSSAFTYITETKKGAFANNAALVSLQGFSALQTIGDRTFENCTSLTTTSGLANVKTIGIGAFSGCSGLTTVRDFGGYLTTIKENAFTGCKNISTIFMALENPPTSNGVVWNSGGELSDNVFDEEVFAGAFLYVPVGAEHNYIATPAWDRFNTVAADGTSRIRSRSIIFSFKNIARGDTIPAGACKVSASGSWTISYGNQQTKTFTAGTDVPVPGYTFASPGNPSGQIEVKISGAVTSIKGTVLNQGTSQEKQQSIFGDAVGRKLQSIASSPAMEISSIGEWAFVNCSALTQITTMPSVQEVGYGAFQGATSLVNVSGLSGVTTIDSYAFSGCSSLTSLYGLSNVSTINSYAFNGCVNLKKIDGLGANITSIGDYAFRSCTSIEEVQVFAENPPAISDNTFNGLNLSALPLYVRTKSLSEYQGNSQWNRFANIRSRYIEFTLDSCPANLTIAGIGKVKSDTFWMVDWDLYNSDGINGGTGDTTYLPEHTFSLSGNHTFRIEGAVTEISADGDASYNITENEPNSENQIIGNSFISFIYNGNSVESTNHYLTRVERSEYSPLKNVGKATFLHNENLQIANLAGITSIGESAFAFSGIKSLNLLQAVSEIGDYAFYGCSGFHNVTNLGGDKITIGEGAFARIGTDDARLKYIQISVSDAANAKITDTSFGWFDSELLPPPQKAIYVYVPLNSVSGYAQNEQWGKFTIDSQLIEFTLENVPSGTTILGVSATDSIGVGTILSDSDWTIDWGDGTISSMEQTQTALPAHTYEFSTENAGYWTTQIIDGVEVHILPRAVIGISGDIISIGCRSNNDSPFLATTRGMGNPYLTKIVASESMKDLTTIGDYTFQGCTALESVSGFVNVQTIGRFAFQGCSNLVGLGNADSGFANVTAIGSQAFADCSSLSSLSAFPKVLSIGVRAFSNCISLSGTYGLGSSYKELSYSECPSANFSAYAFEGCEFGLINMEGYARPPIIQNTTFSGDPKDVIVEVQPNSLEDYKAAAVWLKYWENIIAAAPISIKFGPGVITAGMAIYGGNGRLAFDGQAVVIDWGDGTTTQLTAEPDTNLWTLPSHIYDSSFVGGGSVTISIRGQVSDIWSDDPTKPFIAISETTTRTIIDETTGTSSTITELSGEPIYNASILSVSFGAGSFLKTVGEGSFIGCNIASIFFGKPKDDQTDNGTIVRTIAIGNSAFEGCVYTTSIATDEGAISSIGKAAFKGCTILTSVKLPSSVHSIGGYAFAESGISSFEWDASDATGEYSFDSDASYIFANCSNLKSITGVFPPVKNIPNYAFYGCRQLRDLMFIPTSVEQIGANSFEGCSLAGGISLPTGSSLISIGSESFKDCMKDENGNAIGGTIDLSNATKLTSIFTNAFVDAGETYLILPSSENSLLVGEYAFSYNTNLRRVSWPKGENEVSYSIGAHCFEGCSNLSTVESFGGVKTLPAHCFFLCKSLENIDNVLVDVEGSIGNYCFAGCESLGIVTLPSAVNVLGEGCFNCSTESFLRGIYPGKEMPADPRGSYGSISGFIEWMVGRTGTTGKYGNKRIDIWEIYDSICYRKDLVGPTEIVWDRYKGNVESERASLGDGCFMNCSKMTFRNGSPALPTIKQFCFYNCSSLFTNILGLDCVLSNNTVSIGRFALAHTNIKNLTWEGSNKNLALVDAVFLGCNQLESLDGIDKVFSTFINSNNALFYGCSALSDISALKEDYPIKKLGNYCFTGCTSLKFDMSEGSVFDSLRNVTQIGDGCFKSCMSSNGSSEIYIPPMVSRLPYRSFADNPSITAVIFSYDILEETTASSMTLEGDAFAGCPNVWEISLPFPGVTSVVNASGKNEEGDFNSTDPFPNIAMVDIEEGGEEKKNAFIMVPNNYITLYRSNNYWQQYKDILASEINTLPPNYQRLQYIEAKQEGASSQFDARYNIQYIDTEYIHNGTTQVQMAISFLKDTPANDGGNESYYGARNTKPKDSEYFKYSFSGWVRTQNQKKIFLGGTTGGGSTISTDQEVNIGKIYNIVLDKASNAESYVMQDGDTVPISLGTGNGADGAPVYDGNPLTDFIFAIDQPDAQDSLGRGPYTPNFPCPMRLYSCKIYDKKDANGNTVERYSLRKKFVPVRNTEDNSLGLYDLVAGKFHKNEGGGVFTAGPKA